jgi:hypothetical protein
VDFPASVPIKTLDQEHPEYSLFKDAWRKLALLYAGGSILKRNASEVLTRRVKEHSDVYASRQDAFNYSNLLGNIAGWYVSSMFAREPDILQRVASVEDIKAAQDAVPPDVAAWIAKWSLDCDRHGGAFPDKFRQVLAHQIVYGASWVLIDLPDTGAAAGGAPGPQYASLAQQEAAGALDPVILTYAPDTVKNWQMDDYGNVTGAVLKVQTFETSLLAKTRVRDCWYCYTPDAVAAYEAFAEAGPGGDSDKKEATLVAGYPRRHALSDKNRVPLRRIDAPEGMWFGDRVMLPLLKHLNMENALDWQIFQSSLAMLAVFGPYDETPTMSEVSWLHFPNEKTRAEWLEPEGKAMATHAVRLHELREDVYRSCYLIDQARSNKATPAAQSGVSKEQDKSPSKDAQEGFGDALRVAMQTVLDDVLTIRGYADIECDIRGFDFADKGGAEDVEFITGVRAENVQSDTLDKELQKKIARIALADANPAVYAAIDAEIDAAPTKTELDAAAAALQQAAFAQGLSSFTS